MVHPHAKIGGMDIFTIFYILILILSIIVHEVSHGYAALALGDPTAKYQGRLTLNPLKHIDPMGSVIIPAILVLSNSSFLFGWAKPVPYNPYNLRKGRFGEAIVAGAGPLTNILIAVFFALVIHLGKGILSYEFMLLSAQVVYMNLILAIFNLIPAPPLDGSKILKAFLPFPLARSLEQFEERLGNLVFILPLLIAFGLWPIISPVLKFFLNILL